MATQSTLSDLMLAASRADALWDIHWRCCRQRRNLLDCLRCDELEGDVLASDRDLRAHFEAMVDAASCPVIGCDCAEGAA